MDKKKDKGMENPGGREGNHFYKGTGRPLRTRKKNGQTDTELGEGGGGTGRSFCRDSARA